MRKGNGAHAASDKLTAYEAAADERATDKPDEDEGHAQQ